MKTRVLHISETFAGGVYLYIKDICKYTEENENVENFVIYSGKRKGTAFEKFPKDFSQNTKLIQIDMEREISPIKDLISAVRISKLIKEIGPNVIHLHSSKGGVLGRIASRNYSGAKLFYTPNGYSFVRKDISRFKRSMFKLIESAITKIFGGITIACGDTEYEHAKKIGKAILIRNGVNIANISKYYEESKSGKITIGTVGRLSHQKNPILFNRIANKFKEVDFVWVGDGKLKNVLDSKNISVTGWLSRDEVLQEVNKFDVYLQTSLWEGLPFSIIEAMALKKPIVANNVIGNKDAVFNEKNGYLCESLHDFENAIRKLITDTSIKKEMGNQSFEIAKELFDRNRNLKELFEVYSK